MSSRVFVSTDPSGHTIQFIETDNAGGGAKLFMTGMAIRQDDESSDNNDQGNNHQNNGKGH